MIQQKILVMLLFVLFSSTLYCFNFDLNVLPDSSATATDSLWRVSEGNIFYNEGNVGIGTGTDTPEEKLTVKGVVYAEEIIIDLEIPHPDYVFEEDYKLMTLSEVEAFVKKNKHLPEIPSASEVESNGLTVGEMQTLLLKKIEELTLHMIKQEKILKKLENDIELE